VPLGKDFMPDLKSPRTVYWLQHFVLAWLKERVGVVTWVLQDICPYGWSGCAKVAGCTFLVIIAHEGTEAARVSVKRQVSQ
jgi:hypothetical protein